jgi:3-oxoacyl-[acyl-carrier protein] reductase
MKDKVAIVTGSARGIGRAIALRLAKDGFKVVVSDLVAGKACENVVNEISSSGGIAIATSCDVTDTNQVKQMISHVIETFDRIDVLVNNAGIAKDNLLLRISDQEWAQTLNTNLTGTFHCTRAVIRQMMKQKQGRIINISSVVGLHGNTGQAHYAASKAGIIGFTRSIAREYGSRGITANAVAPGYIETPMTANIFNKYHEEILSRIPLGRPGTPEDIASVVAFLASPDANYINGQVLVVDGGMW